MGVACAWQGQRLQVMSTMPVLSQPRAAEGQPIWCMILSPQAYSARLRLPRGKATHEQQGIVEDVMDMLQLRHVQHQVVGTAEKRGVR